MGSVVSGGTGGGGGSSIPLGQKGTANGVATLDSSGLIPAAQVPPLDSDWTADTDFVAGQLVTDSGVIYRCTTAHTSTNVFDGSKFEQVSATGESSGITVTPILTAGTTRTLAQGTAFYTIQKVTLDQASCAFTFTGFTTVDGLYREMLVQVVGHSGRTFTFTDTFASMSAGYVPVAVTSGITEFSVWTDGDGDINISHGQRIKTLLWRPFKGNVAVYTDGAHFKVPSDARIVHGTWEVGTAPTGAAMIGDILKADTSLYAGATGNRPTIAISATSSGDITLPASPILAPGDRINFALLQIGSTITGADLVAQLDLLMAS